jgi:hypothetical protein
MLNFKTDLGKVSAFEVHQVIIYQTSGEVVNICPALKIHRFSKEVTMTKLQAVGHFWICVYLVDLVAMSKCIKLFPNR